MASIQGMQFAARVPHPENKAALGSEDRRSETAARFARTDDDRIIAKAEGTLRDHAQVTARLRRAKGRHSDTAELEEMIDARERDPIATRVRDMIDQLSATSTDHSEEHDDA